MSEKSEAWQAEQGRIRDEANRKRRVAAKEGRVGRAASKQEEVSNGNEFSAPTSCGSTKNEPEDKNKTSASKAAASKTNRGSAERMDRLALASISNATKPNASHPSREYPSSYPQPQTAA